jgi:signal transduction histidine kinase
MVVGMSNSEQMPFCSLDKSSMVQKEQERLHIIKKLDLLTPETIPICEEATQMVARFLEVPICFLGLMLKDHLWLKSALGLAKLGFMNPIAQERKISRENTFCNHVIATNQSLTIHDTLADPLYANIPLVQEYGIRSYLGIPLITTTGHCLGTLAIMDLVPHSFTVKDKELLALTARWCLRELESQYYTQNSNESLANFNLSQIDINQNWQNIIDSFQVRFFREINDSLRAPLTNIIGMSSVLKENYYGSLNQKQTKYLDIIYKSGHKIASLMTAIAEIDLQDEDLHTVNLTPSDPAMIAQEVISNLENWIELDLVTETSSCLYLLDRKKVRISLYYLIISLLESKNNNDKMTLKISDKHKKIEISLAFNVKSNNQNLFLSKKQQLDLLWQEQTIKTATIAKLIKETDSGQSCYNKLLELCLSCYLAEVQKGEIVVQPCQDFGYEYILRLPKNLAK